LRGPMREWRKACRSFGGRIGVRGDSVISATRRAVRRRTPLRAATGLASPLDPLLAPNQRMSIPATRRCLMTGLEPPCPVVGALIPPTGPLLQERGSETDTEAEVAPAGFRVRRVPAGAGRINVGYMGRIDRRIPAGSEDGARELILRLHRSTPRCARSP
jgi:hypothetical protein